MGALTLKSFPFELRGWDIEKFESLNPTDGFGSNIKIYIHQNWIIQIEPNYDTYHMNAWLTDKGRHFFDGLFNNTITKVEKTPWFSFLNLINHTAYIFDQCTKQSSKDYFLTILFNNLNIETLNMLLLITQNYSFIKLKRLENSIWNVNLESNFQLNSLTKLSKNTNHWNLCLLISTNPRYEGYQLNLKLRQKVLNSNFKCLTIGSIINLTFPTKFLGSNIKVFKTIVEGNNFVSQHVKHAKNIFLIYNNKMLQRNDGENLTKIFKTLNHANIFDKAWNALNVLNSGLSDTGHFTLKSLPKALFKDLETSSIIYFLNTTNVNDKSNLKKIAELKTLKSWIIYNNYFLDNKKIIHQNHKKVDLLNFYNQIGTQHTNLITTNFFGTKSTFINTLGFIKKTIKITYGNKSDWQVIRKLLKQLKQRMGFLNQKMNQIIYYNINKLHTFWNFIDFKSQPTVSLHHLNFFLRTWNNLIFMDIFFFNFKKQLKKFFCTKLKFWLNDFYNESLDEYSQNSKILNTCSKILRQNSSNFFL